MRQAKSEGARVIDVDGSYIYRKFHSSMESSDFESLPLPGVPITGWDVIDGLNSASVKEIPKVTHGTCNTSKKLSSYNTCTHYNTFTVVPDVFRY